MIFTFPREQTFDDNGAVVPGATLWFYEVDSTDTAPVYTDYTYSVEHTQPIEADSAGRFAAIYINKPIKAVLFDQFEEQIWSQDFINVNPIDNAIIFVSNYGAALDGSTADDVEFAAAAADAVGKILIIDGPIAFDDDVSVAATTHVIAQGAITMATGKYFTAMKITHEYEGWTSGFDRHYDLRAFGSYPNLGVSVSQTARFDAAIAAISNGDTLYCSAGVRYFTTKPADIEKSIELCGPFGLSASSLAKNYDEAGGDNIGFITFRGALTNGTHIRDLGIYAGSGSTGGSMLVFVANTDEPVGFATITRVIVSYVDATSQYVNGILIDGSANHSAAPGWRAMYYDNAYAFVSVGGTNAVKMVTHTGGFGSLVSAGPMLITGENNFESTVNLHVDCISTITMAFVNLSVITGKANAVVITSDATISKFHGLLTASGTSSNAGSDCEIQAQNTRNVGTSAIANGGTSIAVAHGCAVTPTAGEITLTQTNNTTNVAGALYVTAITSSQFTVNCRADPGVSTLTFGWCVNGGN